MQLKILKAIKPAINIQFCISLGLKRKFTIKHTSSVSISKECAYNPMILTLFGFGFDVEILFHMGWGGQLAEHDFVDEGILHQSIAGNGIVVIRKFTGNEKFGIVGSQVLGHLLIIDELNYLAV